MKKQKVINLIKDLKKSYSWAKDPMLQIFTNESNQDELHISYFMLDDINMNIVRESFESKDTIFCERTKDGINKIIIGVEK